MPGDYSVQDFALGVTNVSAFAAGRTRIPLRVFHPDPNTWEVAANGRRSVSVEYTVKNPDMEMNGSSPRRAHLVGSATYMYIVDHKQDPVLLQIDPPDGVKEWPVICSLDPVEAKPRAYRAPNYDVLADAPVEMGDFVDETFVAGGKPHHVVLYGDYKTIDHPKLTEYCRRIAETEIALFGEAPFERYVFEFASTSRLGGGSEGGLEHAASTEIGPLGQVTVGVRSVIAHEYFHLWNVKRIRPFVLGPFNYVNPPHTANLWWAEGVTDYYADVLLHRGGMYDQKTFLGTISFTISMMQNSRARSEISADESSLRTWEDNSEGGFGGVSYYTRGELIGLCLDLKIRNASGGRASLDDVMRALLKHCHNGNGPGFGEDDIKATVNRVSGKNLSEFYDLVARSTDDLPFEECLGYAGLTLERTEPPTQEVDSGMHIQFNTALNQILVLRVFPGGPAEKAGIEAGDRITATNGDTDWHKYVSAVMSAKPGTNVNLSLLRGSEHKTVEITLGSLNRYAWKIGINSSAKKAEVALRNSWLGR